MASGSKMNETAEQRQTAVPILPQGAKRDDGLTAAVQTGLSGITDIPIEVTAFTVAAGGSTSQNKGTTSPDEETLEHDDRAVKIKIDRDDSGCEWAYENEVSVYNNIERLDNTLNNGFVVTINEKNKKDKRAKEAKEYIEQKIEDLMLQAKISAMIKNRSIYGFSILKKTKINGDIVGLVELDCHEERCFPLWNSMKADLGVGKDALVLKGKIAEYTEDGVVTHKDKTFKFKRDEIIWWNMNDRGKFKSVSPVKRVLRLVEIKKCFENSADLIVKRFGPQIWIMVGNEKYNIGNAKMPKSYTRDSAGNIIDEATARNTYRRDLFKEISDKVQKWADGETLVQIAEYGVDVKTLTPNTNLTQYSRYIDLFADYIKVGIFGLDIAGRVDVTSAIMQDRLYRDLKDKARKERTILMQKFRKELFEELLAFKKFPIDIVNVDFKPLDPGEDQQDALTEFRRSQAARNWLEAGGKIPTYLQEKWGLENMKPPVLSTPVTPPIEQPGRKPTKSTQSENKVPESGETAQ